MAIAVEFINVLIPIIKIDEKYPGGFKKYKENNAVQFKNIFYHDKYLTREGAMSPQEIEEIVNYFETLGLIGYDEKLDKWIDIVVVDQLSGPTRSCDWLDYDSSTGGYFMKGTEPGELIRRKRGNNSEHATICFPTNTTD